ncbi:anti-sigma B factor antagonist [Desulfacinum infernum DSM 9756]|uniref:Anti-sigma factor antagonist n=1 Tax=Desulfacinum infernum DSM 9756 TaxID=1121391 RepID=A0A1M4SSG1_9BACT|nr:STAS domain-containing protein [Desulfacinum infernum]SHE35082.1 anti-sigma B factor antagonist [Desulfacinum infernum DSM 9756]
MGIRLDWNEDGAVSVAIEGRLDLETVPGIRKELLKAFKKRRPTEVVVDLEGIGRMDTAGVALLVELRNLVSGKGGSWRLERVSESVMKMLELARLDILADAGADHGRN